VILADDHTELLDALRRLLEPDFEVVASVKNGASLLRAVKTFQPDLAVVDISMPELSGIEAAERLRKTNPGTKIVFLTMHQDAALARRALRTGALGYVLKVRAHSELVAALREALHQRCFISSLLRGKIEGEN
jgi:DNA-binding NarL/FixJ family response regulator